MRKVEKMQTKVSTPIIIFLVFAFIIFIPLHAQAIDYYVDQNHPSANDINPGTEGQPWKTITRANQTLVSGDTVYIKAGTYTSYIAPSNSGTAVSRITYRSYGSDVVTISGTSYAVYLNGKSYITVDGIRAKNCQRFLYIVTGTNNIISNNIFDLQSPIGTWSTSYITMNSQYNWIHHNQFSNCGSANNAGVDDGACLEIGRESTSDATQYNLIENNTLFHGGHHVAALMSQYNTFRNNYIHNEAWTGIYGNRSIHTISPASSPGRNIIEGNKLGYSAIAVDQTDPPSNFPMVSQNNIFRYNRIYHSAGPGLALAGYSGYSNAANNRIYNNTFFNNGLVQRTAVLVENWEGQTPVGNVFKNNLYYSHANGVYSGPSYSTQSYANEYNGDVRGNPLFVNASTTPPAGKMDSSVPNLDLQAGSPAINQGGPLTTVAIADTGSGTSLVVSDARYFQDGTYAPAGTMSADWIAVGTVSNVVHISSINYATNTITLANSISRSSGQSVWLYKKSDGARVLYGTAPDAGAYEVPQSSSPSAPLPPTILRII